MSEKSLRDAVPGVDQARDPAAPAAPSGGRSSDSGGAPVEPWAGERTDRVSGREGSGARVVLVPVVPSDGRIEGPASTADTRRVADSGRTTLMGVPSPMAPQSDKPTTSPGHDVHLPSEKGRVADARPIAASGGVIPAVELDPSSTRRIGKVEAPGKSSDEIAGDDRARDRNAKGANKPASEKTENDSKGTAVVPSERTMAAAAATFRASNLGGGKQPGPGPGAPEPERSWTADRTQEFHLDPPPTTSPFAKTLAVGIALAVGMGILVVGFVHARVRGAASDQGEVARSTGPGPMAPLPLLPPPPPENPVPPAAVDLANSAPTNAAPAAAAPEAPRAEGPPEPAQQATDTVDDPADLGKGIETTDRRLVARGKVPAPAGRTAPSSRTPRSPTTVARPGVIALPGAPPSLLVPAGAAGVPTSPPPLTAAPQPERPAIRAEPPRTEGAKPYDPDMPLPPSAE